MRSIADFFATEWARTIGWTLLHSLWQAMIVILLLVSVLRLLPTRFSQIRYIAASAALFLVLVTCVSTFLYLTGLPDSSTDSSSGFPDSATQSRHMGAIAVAPADHSSATLFSRIVSSIELNMPLFLTGWVAGFMFFVLRFVAGIYYMNKLRSGAVRLDNEWSDYVSRVRRKLGIARAVTLAESLSVITPVVIGYIKPMILIPAGMLSGLSTEQVETILLHELAHIRRHDYLINFIQAVAETIFFFNPFIWILSSIIRREREYCCDDLVVRQHGSANAYAHALAQLAESRLSAPAFGLPLGEGRKQLLNRIRRIMEKSIKDYSAKRKLLAPAVLLITALFCVSWLGINGQSGSKGDPAMAEQDTVKRKKEKGAHYSRRSVITVDENGQPHEQVVEEFEGDEALRPLVEKQFDPDVFPPEIPDVPAIPPFPHLDIQGLPDSVPPPSFPYKNREEWEEFSRELNENLRKRFEEISAFRERDGAMLMERLQEQFAWVDSMKWPMPFQFDLPAEPFERFQHFNDTATFKHLEEQLERLHGLDGHLRNLEEKLRLHQGRLHEFEDAIRERLTEDGYLTPGEDIESLQWGDDSFKVNGKELKEADREKYRKLHENYLGGKRSFPKAE